jgi:hypothetical protein
MDGRQSPADLRIAYCGEPSCRIRTSGFDPQAYDVRDHRIRKTSHHRGRAYALCPYFAGHDVQKPPQRRILRRASGHE